MSTITQNLNGVAGTDAPTRARVTDEGGLAASMPSTTRVNAALTVLRAVAGTVFAVHGAQKLFVFGLAGVAGAFEGMGVPLAGIVGPAVAFLEFFGGLALIAGLFTRPVAIGLAGTMLGALLLVHLPAGFFLPNGYEFVLTLLGAAAALALTGAGGFSIDALISRRRAEP